jgi:peroxiredoxin
MTNPRFLAVFGALALLAIGAVLFRSKPRQAQETAPTDRFAPAWKLPDLDGREVSSEQFKGKVVVVDFWATWCPPCVAEIPGYIELQKKYGSAGLVMVGVSLDQKGPAHVKKFATAKGMNYTLVMGDDSVVEAFGGVEAIPTTFLIDRQGRIIHRKTGAVSPDEYEQLVRRALK